MENKIRRGILPAFLLIFVWFLLDGWACPFWSFTGIPCPGCGMSRALFAFLKGNLELSLFYHPFLIPTGICALLGGIFWFKNKPKWAIGILWVWIIGMLVYYGYRMLFLFPNEALYFDQNAILIKILRMAGLFPG